MKIEVTKQGDSYNVVVKDGESATEHTVTLQNEDYERLTAGQITHEELIERSFGFLLARESKEAILKEFDLSVISDYFPAFESEIKHKI